MERDIYRQLLSWKKSENRKPLILRGARQVGKTHLLKKFGRQEYPQHIYLNFEEDSNLSEFFKVSLRPQSILEKLTIYFGQAIQPHDTLLIFDEIQECPEALNSLKYFREEGNEYHIAAAGSLLGIKLAHTKGFPVGKVNFMDLFPLTFLEYLTAIEKASLRKYLEEIKTCEPLPEPFHTELLDLLKTYYYIGGMPEVIAEYAKNKNLLSIRDIQKDILKAYDLDFAKHAPKDEIMKIMRVWESIPDQLAKENKKFIFSAIKQGARAREYESAIQWLTEAGLILKSYYISAPKLPLSGYVDHDVFKVFLLDVGLLSTMSNIPEKSIIEKNSLFSEFYGAFTENFIAQELTAKQYPLRYWASSGTAEVDFVIEKDLEVYPVEVKYGTSKRKKSLLVYDEKYKPKHLLRCSSMNLKKDGKVCNIPLYLIGRFADLI